MTSRITALMELSALGMLSRLTRDQPVGAALPASLQLVSDAALTLTAADHASVRLCHADGTLGPGARSGVGLERPPPVFVQGQGVLGWVAKHGRVARVPDASNDRRFEDRRERGFPVRSVLSAPLFVDREVRGVLSASSREPDAFAEQHEQAAVLLSTITAQQLRLAELSRRTITDPHTNAYNRAYLEPRLEEELSRSRRSGDPLSLMLLDLDHFKRINDSYGHAAGDEVLRLFVGVMRGCIRGVDVLVRRGGEEFVVILPATSTAEAELVAERVRGRLAQRLFRLTMGATVRQTASIGVAGWDGRESALALEMRADAAMYRAKRAGRNRVCVAHAEAGFVGRRTLGKGD